MFTVEYLPKVRRDEGFYAVVNAETGVEHSTCYYLADAEETANDLNSAWPEIAAALGYLDGGETADH